MEALETTLTALLHGESGVGKSWLADTVPGPRLILDLEGRAKYTPSGPKILWDVRTQAPPVHDGTWDTCVVMVPDFDTLTQVFTWLRSGQHPFVSVVVDSLMEAQKRCIDARFGAIALDQQGWGTLLRELEKIVRDYRDLTLVPSTHVRVVVFVTGSVQDGKNWRPLLQGALKDTVPYYIDLVGYYFLNPMVTAEGATVGFVRSLLVEKRPGFIAKDGTGKIVVAYPDGVVPEPNITALVELLHVHGKAEAVA